MKTSQILNTVALLVVCALPVGTFVVGAYKTLEKTSSMSSQELACYDVDPWTGQLILRETH